MSSRLITFITAAGAFAYLSAGYADDTKSAATSNKMTMDQMMGMRHDCMNAHRDGKTCDKEAMDSCEKGMKKAECKKMMKQVKSKEKTDKKKS